tara:strand:- start:836 stop:1831 length:996 start_codon:yes stop_codon:yes gene_type:complete
MAEIIPQLPPRGQTSAGSLGARGQRLQNRFLTGVRNQQIINSGIMEMLEQRRAADVRQAAANRLADSARGIQGPSPQRFGFQTRIAGALPPRTRGSAIVPITNVATKTPLLSRITGFLGNPFVGALTLVPPLTEAMTATGEFMRSDRGKMFKDGFRNFDVPQMLDAVAGRQVLPRDRGLVFTSGAVPEGFDPSAPDALSTALEQARGSGVDVDSLLRPRAVDAQDAPVTDSPVLEDSVSGNELADLYASQKEQGIKNMSRIQEMYKGNPGLQSWAKNFPALAQREFMKAERRTAAEGGERGISQMEDPMGQAAYDEYMKRRSFARKSAGIE